MPDWNDQDFWNRVGGQFGTGGPTSSVRPTNIAPPPANPSPTTDLPTPGAAPTPAAPPAPAPAAAPAPGPQGAPGIGMLLNQLFQMINRGQTPGGGMPGGFSFGNMAAGQAGDQGPGAEGAPGGVGTVNFGDGSQLQGNPIVYQNGVQQGPGPQFIPAGGSGGGVFSTSMSPTSASTNPTGGPAPINLPQAPSPGGFGTQGPFGGSGPTYGDFINLFGNGYSYNQPLGPGDGMPGTSQLFGSGTEGQPGANGGSYQGANGGWQGNVGGYGFGQPGGAGGQGGGGGDMPWQRSAAEREAR